jgi:hypothetical protein
MNLLELLQEATKRFPPHRDKRHYLALTDEGFLQIIFHDHEEYWDAFLIDSSDQEKEVNALLDEIAELRKQQTPSVPPKE